MPMSVAVAAVTNKALTDCAGAVSIWQTAGHQGSGWHLSSGDCLSDQCFQSCQRCAVQPVGVLCERAWVRQLRR